MPSSAACGEGRRGLAPPVSGRAFVGTSGCHTHRGGQSSIPRDEEQAFLSYYATRLATIEINYTVNHLPTEKNVAEMAGATPDGFIFG